MEKLKYPYPEQTYYLIIDAKKPLKCIKNVEDTIQIKKKLKTLIFIRALINII